MRIWAGPHHHVSTNGRHLWADCVLTQQQVDSVVRILMDAGYENTSQVCGIEWTHEGPPIIYDMEWQKQQLKLEMEAVIEPDTN